MYYNYYRKRGLMEIKCVVEKIDRDVNEIMNLKYPYLPEKYFKKYLENEDKFSKLGIIINDYLEKILSLENENVYVDNAKDVERILNYYQKSVLLYPEFDGEILAKGLISDVYSGKLKLPITVDDVMLCEVDEYVREDELLFELEWIIIFLPIVYNVGLKQTFIIYSFVYYSQYILKEIKYE